MSDSLQLLDVIIPKREKLEWVHPNVIWMSTKMCSLLNKYVKSKSNCSFEEFQLVIENLNRTRPTINMLDISKFDFAYWDVMHLSAKYRPNYIYDFVFNTAEWQPCGSCRVHAKKYISENPISREMTSEDWIKWTYDYNNSVYRQRHERRRKKEDDDLVIPEGEEYRITVNDITFHVLNREGYNLYIPVEDSSL